MISSSASCYCGYLGALQVWGHNPLHPDTDGGVLLTVPEIPPLDVKDEIEYVRARFVAVTVIATMQKPIRQEDSSNENNRKPQRAREMKNQLGLLAKVKIHL